MIFHQSRVHGRNPRATTEKPEQKAQFSNQQKRKNRRRDIQATQKKPERGKKKQGAVGWGLGGAGKMT